VQIQRYRARISGPLLDRIDLHIEAPALSLTELRAENPAKPRPPCAPACKPLAAASMRALPARKFPATPA